MISAEQLLKHFPEHLRTSNVSALLRGMVESGDWSTIPLMQDALQDAGATGEELQLPLQARDYALTMKAFADFTRGAAEAGRVLGEAMLPAFRAFAEIGESLVAAIPPALLSSFANETPAPVDSAQV